MDKDNFAESICLVTAFLDINREKWTHFKRSLDQYFRNFTPYTLMKDQELIVFIDELHLERLTKLCCKADHIKIIPINREWMKEHIHAYSQLQREQDIMNSTTFQKLVGHRIHNPECCNAEYNILQHAKVDFVAHVIHHNLTQAKYLAWTDFGYFQIPNRVPNNILDLEKFDKNKVNIMAITEITSKDSNVLYTLQEAPERVGGFFHLGNRENLLLYRELYHQVCQAFYQGGIVDDDQHITLQCLFRNPGLFRIWNLNGWHLTYNYFQKK
jgi:protein YibB